MSSYIWGYHSSDPQYVHVSRVDGNGRVEDLFDVTLYDPEVIDPNTGRNGMDQSLEDLKELLAAANRVAMPDAVADTILTALDWYEDDRMECQQIGSGLGDLAPEDYEDLLTAIQQARDWVQPVPQAD